MKAMRKMRVFQNQNYLSMDFIEKSTERTATRYESYRFQKYAN